MLLAQTPELFWLVAVTALTGLLWIPHILDVTTRLGLRRILTNRTGGAPEADWAKRAKAAHANAVENLVIFAPLALGVHALGVGDERTALAAQVYFWARLAHFVVYALGLPTVRTLAFFTALGCNALLALRLFGLV